MLNLILGVEGTGKSTAVLNKLEKLANEGKRAVFIVPEQFTFETERTIYNRLGARGAALIAVLSFSKLADAVVAAFGGGKAYADDIVKELLMYRAVKGLPLSAYARQAGGADFPTKMLKLIGDVKAAGYSADDFRKKTDRLSGETPSLKARLSDIAAIYTAYDELLNKEFADRLDNVRLSARLIDETPEKVSIGGIPLSSADIFLDGFDSFNGSEWLLLYALLIRSASLTMTVCTDEIKSITPEYISQNDIIRRLSDKAGDYSIRVFTEKCQNAPRKPKKVYFSEAEDIYSECEGIAARIREKVMTEDCRYSDIAVILRDDSYLAPLESKLKSYEISGFVDLPQSILSKPLVNFSLLALKASQFGGDSVLKLIKSRFLRIPTALSKKPFLGRRGKKRVKPTALRKNVKSERRIALLYPKKTVALPRSVIDRFEKAATLHGIVGDGWKRDFIGKNDKELNLYRKYIADSLSALSDAVSDTTGDKITEALCDFLMEKNQIQAAVSALCNRNDGFKVGFSMDETLRDEYRRLWELMISVFESFHEGLKNVPVSVSEYLGLLTRAFSKVRFSKAPTVLDAITVGDPERSRTNGKRYVFVAGFSQGLYPAPTVPNGEFSGEELERLSDSGIELYETRMPRYYREQFIINRALSLASDSLYLSSPERSVGCQPVEPSSLLRKINPSPAEKCGWLYSTIASAKARLAEIYSSENDRAEAEGLSALLEENGSGDYAERLFAARKFAERYSGKIEKAVADKLFDKNVPFSPSGIEALCGCSFKYFCHYVMGVLPGKTIEIDRLTIGNAVHYCLERAVREYIGNPALFGGDAFLKNDENDTASLEMLSEKVGLYMTDYREESLGGDYSKTKSFDEIYWGLRPGIYALLLRTLREISRSGFKPKATELRVGGALGAVKIEGKLDRLDEMTINKGTPDEKRLLRVIDYKTGSKDFSLPLVYYGLDLQMLLYLFLACDGDRDALPSGTAYYRAGGIACEKIAPDKASEATFNRQWYDEHRVSGLQLRAVPEGKATVKREDELEAESLLNYYRSADCGDSGRKAFVNNTGLLIDDYQRLKDYCTELIEGKARTLWEGNISENPIRDKELNPCKSCDYRELCRSGGRHYTLVDKAAIFERVSNVAELEKKAGK